MKITTVISPDGEDEIVISCRERSDKVVYLETLIKNALGQSDTLLLTMDDTQYFISSRDIIFCESLDGKVICHTRDKIFYSSYRLYELEKVLPHFFCRASKSTIVNGREVYSIKKNITGASEISFKNTEKRTYLSRSYYKMFMEKINEMRLI